MPGGVVERGVLERVDDVVLVDELKPRVEARAPSAPAAAANMRVNAVSTSGPRTLAQRSMVIVDVRVALGELADRLLGLDDVALERRCAAGAGAASPR